MWNKRIFNQHNNITIMNISKAIICLIIAAAIYLIVGLIAWNIVCSWIDMGSCTLIDLSNYRIYTYSGLAFLAAAFAEKSESNVAKVTIIIAGFLALVTNYWEGIWDSVAVIITIMYNAINVIAMAYSFYNAE